MDYILTDHAHKRCIKRKIQLVWIENALEDPAHHVIYDEGTNPIVVVTAYFDNHRTIP